MKSKTAQFKLISVTRRAGDKVSTNRLQHASALLLMKCDEKEKLEKLIVNCRHEAQYCEEQAMQSKSVFIESGFG